LTIYWLDGEVLKRKIIPQSKLHHNKLNTHEVINTTQWWKSYFLCENNGGSHWFKETNQGHVEICLFSRTVN